MFKIGDEVKRLDGGYTKGRTGKITKLTDSRARVAWTKDSFGSDLRKCLRTWVVFTSIAQNDPLPDDAPRGPGEQA